MVHIVNFLTLRSVAPRQMGDGYIVAKSNSVKLCYLWDEAGLDEFNFCVKW